MKKEVLTIEIKPSEDFKQYIQQLSKDIKELIEIIKVNNLPLHIYDLPNISK